MRSGYKQTEVGTIPQDWDICLMGNVLKRNPQYGINAPSVKYQDNLPTYIRITDISEGGLFEPDEMVAVDHRDSGQYYLEEGDLVFARTGASVGKSYRYNPMDGQLVFAGFLIRVTPDKRFLHPGFLAQYVKTQKYWNWVRLMSMRSGQPGINGNEYGQLPLPLPSLKEQRAIAKVLGDVDDLLASLDRLIAKKRAVKLAAMQQLLTGKKRLAGWNGRGYKRTEIGLIPKDWNVVSISEIGEVKGGKRLPKGWSLQSSSTPFPYIRVTDMRMGGVVLSDIKYVPEEIAPVINNYRIKSMDIFISVAGTLGIIGTIPKELDGANLTENANKITNISCDKSYLLYMLLSQRIQNEIDSQKTLGAQPKLALGRIENFKIPLPENVEEQRAIATILSDMDAEISVLQARRDKTAAIKQGMMQQLLTGETRLV